MSAFRLRLHIFALRPSMLCVHLCARFYLLSPALHMRTTLSAGFRIELKTKVARSREEVWTRELESRSDKTHAHTHKPYIFDKNAICDTHRHTAAHSARK